MTRRVRTKVGRAHTPPRTRPRCVVSHEETSCDILALLEGLRGRAAQGRRRTRRGDPHPSPAANMTATPAADRAAPSSDPFVGQQAGGYVITRPLGEGGMGVVYEARHATLAQRAAVKVLRRELASSERDLQRFVNEAHTVAAVQHPGIVKIFDIGQIDGTPFILMELLDGEPLHARLDRVPGRRLPLVQVLDFASQAAAALSFTHGRGFVHRDFSVSDYD
jgi:serine/threonine-protein kinase